MQFLKVPEDSQIVSFLTASEESGFLHLYHYTISLQKDNFTKVSEGIVKSINLTKRQVTNGEWCIDADENLEIDQDHHLVYFHGYMDPTEKQLWVNTVWIP